MMRRNFEDCGVVRQFMALSFLGRSPGILDGSCDMTAC
jgi:hypothetical protein